MIDPDVLAGWVALVLEKAGDLRAAGVLAIGAEGCSVTFAPLPPAAPVGDIDKSDAPEEGLHPLDDPASYPGGVVPGYRIEKLTIEE